MSSQQTDTSTSNANWGTLVILVWVVLGALVVGYLIKNGNLDSKTSGLTYSTPNTPAAAPEAPAPIVDPAPAATTPEAAPTAPPIPAVPSNGAIGVPAAAPPGPAGAPAPSAPAPATPAPSTI